MRRAPTLEAFLGDPIGQWVVAAPCAMAFCVDPHVGGAVVWGAPSSGDTELVLRAYEAYERLAAPLSLVLDCSAVTKVDPDAVAKVLGWVAPRRADLIARVGIQFGVVPRSLLGMTLAGILPTLGDTHRFRVVHDARVAFRTISTRGDAIHDEVVRIVDDVRHLPRALRELRVLLRQSQAPRTVGVAARRLAVAPRTLQRVLAETGTSFRAEWRAALFERVEEPLRHGHEKIETIARRVGISVSTLSQLVRRRTGTSPRRLRSSGH